MNAAQIAVSNNPATSPPNRPRLGDGRVLFVLTPGLPLQKLVLADASDSAAAHSRPIFSRADMRPGRDRSSAHVHWGATAAVSAGISAKTGAGLDECRQDLRPATVQRARR